MPTPFALTPTGWDPGTPPPRGFPSPQAVHRLHDRYLREAVEGLGLCPFARRSREAGRVHRPLLAATTQGPSPAVAAASVARCVQAHPDAEILLLTFVPTRAHPWWDPRRFEGYTREVRQAHGQRAGRDGLPEFYMVSFHPFPPDPSRDPTPENLVPQIRRTPDPVIQCVRAELLDRIRAESQETARARLQQEIARLEPELRALLAGSVATDPALSSDIARHNFDTAGTGPGRARLMSLLDDLLRARRDAYPPAVAAPAAAP